MLQVFPTYFRRLHLNNTNDHFCMTQLKKIYDKTAGGKTVAATALWLAMRIANGIKPDLIPAETQLIIYDAAELLALLGITDKIYRNRGEIYRRVVADPVKYIKNLLTKK
jgi:hypothetical protein